MPNENGHRDADALKALLIEHMGYREENIISLKDATLADLQKMFGSIDNPTGDLAEMLRRNPRSEVLIYVSSHGSSAADSDESYLLPVDANLGELGTRAFPLSLLYANLSKLNARSIMLLIEADFGGRPGVVGATPPNLPERDIKVFPDIAVPGLVVLSAADRDQHTLEDPEFGIGLFTRFLIEGLGGKADEQPIGNADQRVDIVELYAYTNERVRRAALKSFSLQQKPRLKKAENVVVGRLQRRQQ